MFIGLLQVKVICHVTLQDQPTDVSRRFLSRCSPRYVTTLISFVTIGILIVKRENTSSKTWINSYSHWKIAWAPGERKMSQTQKITFWDKEPESYKSHIIFSLHFITMFYNFALKIESSRAKRVVKSISEARVTIVIWSIHSWIKKIKMM